MTTQLSLAPDLQDRETAFSFVSRLAAMNGVDTAGFCTDMGLSFTKVIDGNPEILAHLADLSATDVENLRPTIGLLPTAFARSWSIIASDASPLGAPAQDPAHARSQHCGRSETRSPNASGHPDSRKK